MRGIFSLLFLFVLSIRLAEGSEAKCLKIISALSEDNSIAASTSKRLTKALEEWPASGLFFILSFGSHDSAGLQRSKFLANIKTVTHNVRAFDHESKSGRQIKRAVLQITNIDGLETLLRELENSSAKILKLREKMPASEIPEDIESEFREFLATIPGYGFGSVRIDGKKILASLVDMGVPGKMKKDEFPKSFKSKSGKKFQVELKIIGIRG